MKKTLTALILCPLVAAACGGGETTDDMDDMMDDSSGMAAPVGTVTITQPEAGAEVTGPTVEVMLEVEGLQLVPAGDLTPNSGHHHLYLDADLAADTVPVPTVPGSIVHMGDASSTYTFENVEPGEHRLIAVVADAVHVPLQPLVVDTVMFTVVE